MLKKNLVMYMVLVPLILVSILTIPIGATDASLNVEPQSMTVGPPIPTDPFLVNITVNDVTDLYIWQIKIFYNTAVLNCTDAIYPPDHVFAGKLIVPVVPTMYEDYVLFGCSLMGMQPGFDGSGILCQLEFKALTNGTSHLDFSEPYGGDTFLWNSDLVDIPDEMINGEVTVIPEFSSFLVMPLLIIATVTAVYLAAKRPSKKR